MKNYFWRIAILLLILVNVEKVNAQNTDASLTQSKWKAYWITVPNEPAQGYGVYQFRKKFNLTSKPSSFVVHVSADNRFKLYVNGKFAGLGPTRGDLYHWNYETMDIGPLLESGENTISAVVWNFGDMKPEAQISLQTAFVLQGNSAAEDVVNTNKTWKCRRDNSYKPLPVVIIYSYYVAGPGELIDNNQSLQGWKENGFDDANWQFANQLYNGLPKGAFDWSTGWMLVPSKIPARELRVQRLQKLRKVEGAAIPNGFPATQSAFTIPPSTKVTILLDQSFLTNAYPVLEFSKGKNAGISLSYAESLYVIEENSKDWRAQSQKGNRDEIDGKRFVGVKDSVISNGTDKQQFNSLWWRTYRYMQIKIETKEEPLTINDIYGIFTGYPFEMKANFEASDASLQKLMEVGWRTARLCAVETYMDCPYYEQLQYVGDTRIQALVSLFNSGDDRMMRNAIRLLDQSRMAEGLTLSRYPTANAQEIPPFSMWWIGMVHDYWRYRNDSVFVKQYLPGIRQVLWFFSKFQQPDGSLKNVPYWNFTDWVEEKGWSAGIAPIGADGYSASLDLQLLWAYQLAAELEKNLGLPDYNKQYLAAAEKLKSVIKKKYWDATKGMFADRTEKDVYSQHVNSLAILTSLVSEKDKTALAEKLMKDKAMAEATIYFKYYVHLALAKSGFGDQYLDWLDIWRKNLQMGMTTWAEMSDINGSRSDCHAWGSSPNIEFFRIVLGIDSDAPGFQKIKIEPKLGKLTEAKGTMPHPNGEVKVSYKLNGNSLDGTITLPPKTSGRFLWKGKTYPLKAGENSIKAG